MQSFPITKELRLRRGIQSCRFIVLDWFVPTVLYGNFGIFALEFDMNDLDRTLDKAYIARGQDAAWRSSSDFGVKILEYFLWNLASVIHRTVDTRRCMEIIVGFRSEDFSQEFGKHD